MGTPETMRAWAKGAYDCEAAVELLIRSGLADKGMAVAWDGGFGTERLLELAVGGYWSGGEKRLLQLAINLLAGDSIPDGRAHVDLAWAMSSLDRRSLQLALAALAHAGGSHEHGPTVIEPMVRDGELHEVELPVFGQGYLPPLVEWPV